MSNLQRSKMDKNEFVHRSELIENELVGKNHRFIFMEAQPGQGKTTTALQFVEKTGLANVWYQIGEKDRDPFFFLLTLIENLETDVVKSSLRIGKMLRNGEISPADISLATNQLMVDLARVIDNPFVIVIDDLHLLVDSTNTLSVLDDIFDCSPDFISFILLTRTQIPFKSKKVRFGGATVYLTNDDLAFSLQETVLFFSSKKMDNPSSVYEKALVLHQRSEGWIMGMILGERSLGGSAMSAKQSGINLYHSDRVSSYFRTEIINSLPFDFRDQLILLSLLEDIPVALAEKITGKSDCVDKLYELLDQNRFIRLLDCEVETFVFHHLMRETLRLEALSLLDKKKITLVLRNAVDYHLLSGELEKSVAYTLQIGDITDVEKVLEKHGLELLGKNRHGTLLRISKDIGCRDREGSAWIQLFEGILLSEKEPEKSVEHLFRAAEMFLQRKCPHGRLITICQLVYHYFLTASGSASAGYKYLEEAVEILNKIEAELPLYSKALIFRSIGVGYEVFTSDFEKSRFFLNKAIRNAEDVNLSAIRTSSLVFLGYSYLLCGEYHAVYNIAEVLFKVEQQEDVGKTSTMLVQHFLTDVLQVTDDYPNYLRHRSDYFHGAEKDLLQKNHFGPSVILWDVKLLISHDRLNEASGVVEDGLSSRSTLASPHIRSRFLSYKAYLAGLLQSKSIDIEACIEESRDLRNRSSWKGFFMTRNRLISGISYGLIGKYEEAEDNLAKGIEQAIDLGLQSLVASGYMFRAYCRLKKDSNRDCEVVQDLLTALPLMRSYNIDMFWGWTSKILRPVLATAIKHDIEPAYTRKILRKRLHSGVADDGRLIPILEIKYLHDFTISVRSIDLKLDLDLTPKQKDLLGLIISTPKLKISQERVHVEIWPDTSTKKAGTNLDTLISRFRSYLRPLLMPLHVNDYLVVGKGIIALRNCIVDSHEFQFHYKQGVALYDAEKWWQSSNSFYHAHRLWPERSSTQTPSGDTLHFYLAELQNNYLDMTEKWIRILDDSGNKSLARKILEIAWQMSKDHTRITSIFYSYLMKNGEPLTALEVLSKFKNALEREGVSKTHIDQIISDFIVN